VFIYLCSCLFGFSFLFCHIVHNQDVCIDVKILFIKRCSSMQECAFWSYTHTQPFYRSVEIVRDNPGEPVPEETFTHYTHRSHQSAFSIYYDTWHPPYSIHVLCSLFHNLSPSFLWSASWPGTLHFILCTFLHPIIVFFSQHMPIPSQPVPL